jgi:hypothetical protein
VRDVMLAVSFVGRGGHMMSTCTRQVRGKERKNVRGARGKLIAPRAKIRLCVVSSQSHIAY